MKVCCLEWQKAVPTLGLSHCNEVRQCQISPLYSRKAGTSYAITVSEKGVRSCSLSCAQHTDVAFSLPTWL